MARLNTRTSATPASGRASTVDSLYADPPPSSALRGGNTARQSSYSVMSLAQSMNSDKENETPESRSETPRPISKGRPMASRRGQRLPTPDSGSNGSGHSNKRRRTDGYTLGESEIGEDEDENVPIYQDEVDEQGIATPQDAEDEEGGSRYYNPNQNPEERRELRANIRGLHRHMEDNRDEMIKPGNNMLEESIQRGNGLMSKVRQTADAALDSRVLVLASDLAGKKLNASLHGNTGVGIDVDQFISRFIFFTKEHRPAGPDESAPTQPRGRRQTQYDEDADEEDTGEGLDWAFSGRAACFPKNKRPPVPSFLLGPLSVQKRVRAVQTRRARSQRQALGPATRPQEIKQDDIIQSENSNLTHLVSSIKRRLQDHMTHGQERIDQELETIETENGEVEEEDVFAACRRYRVYMTPAGEPAVSLFDFAVNPKSFGQTVENLFYISFLIREGNARVLADKDDLPLLVPEEARTLQQQREQNVEKNQAIFSIDWPTWKKLIDAFDIKEPLIPHRVPEETNVSAGGWYG